MGQLAHQVKRLIAAGNADIPSAQRAQHARFNGPFAKRGSRFALNSDGTSAFPAAKNTVITETPN
jgi:hypothetical protein